MLAGGPAPTASFKAIADEYLGRATIRTVGWQRDVLSRLVYPAFGDRRIEEIRRSEIARLLDQIEDWKRPSDGRRYPCGRSSSDELARSTQ